MAVTRSLQRVVKPAVSLSENGKLKSKAAKAVRALGPAAAPPTDAPRPKPATATYKPYPCDPTTGARFWLIKSEPHSRIDPKTGRDAKFSLLDLLAVASEPWDGVRNHEAKNHMLNMAVGDVCLFYHSNCATPGIVGLAEVCSVAHPDELQFNPQSAYYDPKLDRGAPRWWCVDVRFKRRFRHKVSLADLRENPALLDMVLVKRGRLSVTPVSPEEFAEVSRMESEGPIDDEIDCAVSRDYL